ncbi:hypothetical protein WJX74_007044 [Apatococcus lobatus]|uniref:RING-CH-type domain-containing protein n=1 Tax=Apatococcus lobatus TaxID=904363 RepID=A0AAW1RXN1_9CHLO
MATDLQAQQTQPQDSSNVCWVCYDGPRPSSPLIFPCACPRPLHAECCARWQLHAAGKAEEHACRFCHQRLPDWQSILTPHEAHLPPQCLPTMSVTFNDEQHHIVAQSGPHGYAKFEAEIRKIFGIEADMDMNLVFDCAEPTTGSLLKLNGPGAFNAAVHCAKVSAAKRLRRCQAGHLQREPFSGSEPPEAELQELMLSDDQDERPHSPCVEPSSQSEVACVQPEIPAAALKLASEPSEEQLAEAFNRPSQSSHLPRFYRRYRSGRRIITSSTSEGQTPEMQPPPDADISAAHQAHQTSRVRRTRPRAHNIGELLETLCQGLTARRPRGFGAGRGTGRGARDGMSYSVRLPMDHVYYNGSFQPQVVPDPAALESPRTEEPNLPSQPSTSSLESSFSTYCPS